MDSSTPGGSNNNNNSGNPPLKDGGVVVIQHAYGKHLRVKPKSESKANANGGQGKFARFVLEVHGDKFKFRSNKSGRFLRICKDQTSVDVDGGGGKYTLFRFNAQFGTLESAEFPGYCLGVNRSSFESVMAVNTNNGQPGQYSNSDEFSMRFTIIPLPEVVPHGGSSNNAGGGLNAYYFGGNHSMVVVGHAHGKNLRINPSNEKMADSRGGQGKYAQWSVELFHNGTQCKLKNNRTQRYLRIKKPGDAIDVNGGGGRFTFFKIHFVPNCARNVVKLESVHFPGTYIACKPNMNIRIGGGGRHTVLTFRTHPNSGAQNESQSQSQNASGSQSNEQGIIQEQKQLISQQQSFIAQQSQLINQLQGGGQQQPQAREPSVSEPGSEYAPNGHDNNNNNNKNKNGFELI